MAFPFLALAMAASPLLKGVAAKKAADRSARRLDEQAREGLRSDLEDRNRLRDEARGAIGNQLAAQVSNGLEGGTGTALDALRQSQIDAALDVMEMRRQGDLRARSIQVQASDKRREGKMALLEGVLGAGMAAFKVKSDWAQEKRADG